MKSASFLNQLVFLGQSIIDLPAWAYININIV